MTEGIKLMLRSALTPERLRFLKFCVVGGSGVAVNMAVFEGVQWLLAAPSSRLHFNLALTLGFAVSCLTNFLLNDFWTWGDREKRGRAHFFQRLGTYYVASLSGYGVQAGVGNLLLAVTSWPPRFAVLVGIGFGTVFNFVLNNFVTFRVKRK